MAGADSTSRSVGLARRPLLAAVFALGLSCVITQLVLMREMMGVFAGNELVLGVVLGNWLLLMGAGAALGRWSGRWTRVSARLSGLLIFTALVPPAQIVVLRGLRQFVFLRGEAVGVTGTVLVSFLALLPYCLAAGFFLTAACGALAATGAAQGAGRVYAWDSLGSVAGGVLFSFVLVTALDHVALLAVPGILNAGAAALLAWCLRAEGGRGAGWVAAAAVAAGCLLPAWVLLARPDESSTARQFPGQRLLFRGHSPYGRLVVAESGGQTNFFENGVVLASTANVEQAEESTHFALAQRSGPKRVLLIGGALSGAPGEILRYPGTTLDCVELDPAIIDLGRRFLSADFKDTRLRFCEADGRQLVGRTGERYDAVLLALPDPATAQLNRFFTFEFFEEARARLRPGGVVSFAVGHYENYASPELSRVLSCARTTVARSFRHVLLVPAGRAWFIASDEPLTTNIAAALEQCGVATRWVNRNYLAATLAPDRVADVERAAGQPARINRDFAPVLYYLHLKHWASQFETGSRWFLVLLAGVTAVYLAKLRGTAGVIFASGFAGAAVEIVLLLAMQILAGSVYRQLAWVVTLFMAGLAAGAWAATRRLERDRWPAGEIATGHRATKLSLFLLALGLVAIAALLPAVLTALARIPVLRAGGFAAQGVLLVCAFALALLVGAQFPLANSLTGGTGRAAGRLYTADFIGASLGALLTSIWLVPLAGVAGVCWIAGGLNAAAALGLFLKKRFP